MSFTTKFHDPSGRDIGDIFVDLCNNQTIYGSKTFITTPDISGLVIPIFKEHTRNESNQDIPPGAKYCDIEICGGGGGGGGGMGWSNDIKNNEDVQYIIFGGAGGAGGTYYKLTININEYKKYNIICGGGGNGGTGGGYEYLNPIIIDSTSGVDGGSSIITFCDVNNNVLYTITAKGGGGGGNGGFSPSFNAETILPLVGENLVYNNNGSVHKYSGILIDDISNNESDSNYNQPSGGGGGGSVFLNIPGSYGGEYGLDYKNYYGFPGLNGGSVHLTNNKSSICYNGSLGNNGVIYDQLTNTYTGLNGYNSIINNQLSGGGGGSYGSVKYIYNKSNNRFESSNFIDADTIGGKGGDGFKGGGGGGGGSSAGTRLLSNYLRKGGNGGSGGKGFVNLYFY
jgi:hypothetical protein